MEDFKNELRNYSEEQLISLADSFDFIVSTSNSTFAKEVLAEIQKILDYNAQMRMEQKWYGDERNRYNF